MTVSPKLISIPAYRRVLLALVFGLLLSAAIPGLAWAVDTDGDGLDDSVETNTGVYVSPADTGTDPGNPDTDGDGFDDGLEVSFGTDPLDALENPVENKLVAGDAAAGDQFGFSVSVSGDTAVIGAYFDDDAGTSSGSAYVFTRSVGVWTQQAKLVAGDAAAGDRFGWSVSVSGDTAVIGAYLDDDFGSASGSAYVFTRSAGLWTQQAKLVASDAAAADNFGFSVSVSGDTALIGVRFDDDAGSSSGSAYVFTRSAGVWTQQAKLVAGDAAASDNFGWSVSVSGDTAVIGVRLDDDGGSDSGSAYVFTRSAGVWTQQAKLVASDAAADDLFGSSVSVSGDTAVIGAHFDDDAGTSSGSAYVFTRSAGLWTQQAKLGAGDAAAGDNFGISVSVSGDTTLIGSYFDDDDGSNSGSAYTFDLDVDDDGLLNVVETDTGVFVSASDTGTDPFVADTDGDGLLDGFEVLYGFDPTTGGEQGLDGDGDGLTNLQEQAAGTDPGNPDTDGDGFDDGLEGSFGTDPLDALANPIENKLVASDAAINDQFGLSVSVSGDTAVIGAHLDDDGGSDSGSAYVFTRSAGVWTEQAELVAGDAAANDWFGRSVSVSGDTAVIGAYLDDDFGSASGSAYVFTRSAGVWTQQAKLVASDAATLDRFGVSVSVSGETAAIGATGDDDGGTDSGSAYVFTRSAGVWTQQAKLVALDAAGGDIFGGSVSLSSQTAIIGAYLDDDGSSSSGSAYVFTRSAGVWTQQAKLVASDAAANDQFGRAVSLSGDTAVIGARFDNDAGSDSGSAYVFTRSTGLWTQQAKLVALDAAADDEFGFSVSVSGDTAVIGARFDNDAGSRSGSAYVFTRSAGLWTQQAKLVASDAATDDRFGISASVSGDTAVIGSYFDDDAGSLSGSAYTFDLDVDDDGLLNLVETDTGVFVSASDTGSDPFVADTDFDGLDDGEEVGTHLTDPLNPDTDGDGVFDGDEVGIHFTDPTVPDTDADGLDDGEEVYTHGTDPLDDDSDDDGWTDGTEVTLGTDPLDPNSIPDPLPTALSITPYLIPSNLDDLDTTPTLGFDEDSALVVFTRRADLEGSIGPGDIWYSRVSSTGESFGPAIRVSEDLAGNPTDDVLNDTSGDYIIYTAFENSIQGRVRLFDTQNFTTINLVSGPTATREARIHGDYATWVEGDPGFTYLKLVNLSTPAIPSAIIAGPSPTVTNVEIGSNYIVWEATTGPDHNIRARDFATGTTTIVAATSDAERRPATSGDWVVYELNSSSSNAIMAKNLRTGELRTITEGAATIFGPNIDGDLIVWDSNAAGEFDVYIHRLSTQQTFRVTTAAGDQLLNNIHGDLISWVDFSAGSDVYVAQVILPDPIPVPSMTPLGMTGLVGAMGLLGMAYLRAARGQAATASPMRSGFFPPTSRRRSN